MNVTYTVTVKGLPDKYAPRLKHMLEEDLGTYARRLRMASIEVAEVKQPAAKGKK